MTPSDPTPLPVGAILASALVAANIPCDSGEDVDRLIAEMWTRGLRVVSTTPTPTPREIDAALRDLDNFAPPGPVKVIRAALAATPTPPTGKTITEADLLAAPPVVDITGIAAIRRALVVEMENEGVVTWGDDRHRARFLSTEPSE